MEFAPVQTAADDEVGAARLADAFDDLAHDARAVLDVLATVFVIALVPKRADEAVEKVPVSHVHLDGIEPALLQPHGSLDLQALLLVDLLDRQAARGLAPRLGNRHLVLGQRRGRDRGRPVRGRAGRRTI